jgi:hypothetical protein
MPFGVEGERLADELQVVADIEVDDLLAEQAQLAGFTHRCHALRNACGVHALR